jgi:hypothetical protein
MQIVTITFCVEDDDPNSFLNVMEDAIDECTIPTNPIHLRVTTAPDDPEVFSNESYNHLTMMDQER